MIHFQILKVTKMKELHTIQSMLVHRNASDCSKMSKKMIRSDFVTSSDEFFYAFHRFVDLQSSAFF